MIVRAIRLGVRLPLLAGLATGVAGPRAPAADAPATVAIENFGFQPAEIAVKAGARVRFVNKDQVPHSIVVESGGREISRSPEQVDEDETFDVVLSSPGEVSYYCGLHLGMKGRISVTQ